VEINEIICFLNCFVQKVVLFRSKDFRPPKPPVIKEEIKGGIKIYIYLRGDFEGAKPPTEIWASKAEGLKNRVGGSID